MVSLLFALAHAASFDPELTWRTLQTEHFNIHFHQGEERLAEEVSALVEEIHSTMSEEMGWSPRRRTELMLIDRTDSANGYAMTTPYNAIVVYVTAPDEDSNLGLYDDWTRTILTHEYTHVLHLDTNHGIVRAARGLVGRVASTNSLSPRWMTEGLATLQETRHTAGGRGRSHLADMVIRTAVLEGEFPPLGNLDGFQPDVPGGNLRYLFGEDFMSYVADRQGQDVWTRWTHTYGSSIPFVLPSKKVFGERLVPLYFDWRDHLGAKYAAQVEEALRDGLLEGRIVSEDGASCTSPSFSPDGEKLVWSCNDPRTGSAIWMADGMGYAPEVLLQDRGAKTFTWRADSEAFVYAGLHVVSRFNTWSDVYMYRLGAKRPTALTSGKRARDPDFSPDGSKLVVVTNKVQNNQLEVMTVDQRMVALTAIDDHTQFSTPRWSPDGRALAVSVWSGGRRDLWIYSPEGAPVRRLTADAAIDRDPEWSADGRWLFFSSDRTGIPNIYAIEVATERLFQVTNVATGAVRPDVSPDGSMLAYQQYSADGWDVRLLDLRPWEMIDRGFLARPLTFDAPLRDLVGPVDAPVAVVDLAAWEGTPVRGGAGRTAPLGFAQDESIDTFDDTDVKGVFGEEQDYPFTIQPRRYNPLPTLLPRFHYPQIALTPHPSPKLGLPVGALVGTSTFATDMLRHHAWSASLFYRTDADFVGGSAGWTVNRWLPVFSVGFSRRAVPFPMFFEDPFLVGPTGQPALERQSEPYWEKRHTATASVSWPYRLRTTAFASYSITFRDSLDEIPERASLDRVPVRGRIGRLSGGWRYSWSQPTRYAISAEDGRVFSLVGSVSHPWLGSVVRGADDVPRGLTQVQLTAETRGYVVNPWVPNHVFAGRLAGGVALGDTDFLGNYQLGGSLGDGALFSTPDEFRMLRGYPFAHDVGDMYWLAGFEYRLPLLRFERGVGTLPAYARTLSGVAFVDAGNAFDTLSSAGDLTRGTLVGVGAELRLTMILAWGLPITGRLGYGVGLTPGGIRPDSLDAVYLDLGGSF